MRARQVIAALMMAALSGTAFAQSLDSARDDLGLAVPAPPPLPADRLQMPEPDSLRAAVNEIAQDAVREAANTPQAPLDPTRLQIPDAVLQGLRPKSREDLIRQRMEGTRPQARPAPAQPVPSPETSVETGADAPANATTVGPLRRPDAADPETLPRALDLLQQTRPVLRPDGLEAEAAPWPTLRPRAFTARPVRGAVCGRNDILGDVVGAVPGPGGCGIDQAVRVRQVAGVRLNQPALIDCTTARALRHWVENGAKPALREIGERPQSLRIIGAYSCRTRNNRPGAPLSEHAKGKAVDIAGIRTQSGRFISLLDGWSRRSDGRALKAMHRAACGVFGTVLGPDANRFHRDHFHFDTARHRGGAYCR